MAIAHLHRRAAGPVPHRIERRSRRRVISGGASAVVRLAGWTVGFAALGWLVAAGFYGLLVNA